jgi:hypothetical protein
VVRKSKEQATSPLCTLVPTTSTHEELIPTFLHNHPKLESSADKKDMDHTTVTFSRRFRAWWCEGLDNGSWAQQAPIFSGAEDMYTLLYYYGAPKPLQAAEIMRADVTSFETSSSKLVTFGSFRAIAKSVVFKRQRTPGAASLFICTLDACPPSPHGRH